MGIDWGAKRIGLAVSDPEQKFAFARPGAKLGDLIRGERPVGIVVGLPLFFDGSESETTRRVRAFAETLPPEIPVAFFDETLSSASAAESGASDLDAESARIILEGFINRMNKE